MRIHHKIVFSLLFLLVASLVIGAELSSIGKVYDPIKKEIKIVNDSKTDVTYTLLRNTDYCSEECFAEILINSDEKIKLFDKVEFYSSFNRASELGTAIQIDYSLYIIDKNYTFKEKYNYEEVDKGEYILRIEGNKKRHESVDWIGTIFGIPLSEWAIWGASGVNVTDYHGGTFSEEHAESNLYMEGVVIEVNKSITYNLSLNAISLIAGYDISEPYYLKIATTSGWVNATGNPLTILATFNITNQRQYNLTTPVILEPNKYYLILAGSNDTLSYYRNSQDLSIQQNKTNINFIKGAYLNSTDGFWYSDYPGIYLYNIESITTSVQYASNVNINSPEDGYNSSSKWVNFDCSASSSLSLTNISLWSNFSGTWMINSTNPVIGNSNTTNFNISLPETYSFKWACQACVSDGTCGYTENRTLTILDISSPNITIIQPSGSKTSKTISYNLTITDLSLLSYCYYNVSRGASLEVGNTALNCSNLTGTFSVSSDADYIFSAFANDTRNNGKTLNSSFSVSTSTPVTPPSGGGGGPSVVSGEKGWTMETSPDSSSYDKNMVAGTQLRLPISFTNIGDSSRTITFSCTSLSGDICQYVSFENPTFTLPLLKDVKTKEYFTVSLPSNFGNGKYSFNIKASDDNLKSGIVTVNINVGGNNFFTMTFTKLTSNTSFGVPYLVIFFPLLILLIIIIPLVLRKVPLRALWTIILSLGISFTVVYLI